MAERHWLDLSKPLHLRAEILRAGIAAHQLDPWRPFDAETCQAVREFMGRLWVACVEAELLRKSEVGDEHSTETD